MSKKILIVEDEKEIRDILSHFFKEHGYETDCAVDADEALDKVSKDHQVIFLDLKLPGSMDGMELCRKIRPQFPRASIYALTGYATLYELSDCRKAGFDDYFTKPANLDMLLMAVKVGLDRQDS